MKFPTIKMVSRELKDLKSHVDFSKNNPEIDVRLQVYENGQWAIRLGLSDYDQDHHGFWGSSCLSSRCNCVDIARDLLDQVKDQYFDSVSAQKLQDKEIR